MEGYIIFLLLLILSNLLKNKELQLKIDFIIIAIFSGIRYGIGYDYYSYLKIASGLEYHGRQDILPSAIANFTASTFPLLFFIITSFFISFFYYKGIKKIGENYFLSTLFYLSFPFLFMNQLGIIRQGMATSIIFYMITLKDSKLFIKVLLLILAALCHFSAVVGVMVLIPWERVKKESLWVMLAGSFLIGGAILSLLMIFVNTGLLGEMGTKAAKGYMSEESADEGRMIRYLIIFLAILVVININKFKSCDPIYKYGATLLVFGASLFVLFLFNMTLAKRLSMFFFSSGIFVIPKLSKLIKFPSKLFVILCLLLFGLSVFVGRNNVREEDDPGCSVTYPYRTIFQII